MGVSLKGVAKTMDETQANTVYHNIVKWLSAPDPSTNYNVAQEQRRKGTGSWFLQGQLFQEWNRNRHACTWLHGLSGCGKTILRSSIIGLLQQEIPPPCPLIYFFFDFRDSTKQSLDGMLRSLITQLYQQLPHLRHFVDIETAFLRCVNPEHHVNIQQNMVDTDIRSYVCHRVLDEQAFKRWQRQPKVQARIVEDLTRKAGGM